MYFDEQRRSTSGQPAKEVHHPMMHIGSIPGCTAALVVLQDAFGRFRNLDRFKALLALRPQRAPFRTGKLGLMRAVPGVNTEFARDNPNAQRAQNSSRQDSEPGMGRSFALAEIGDRLLHQQAEP